ncbi:TolC family protein [Geomonas sp. RF6]|nr:TolC family protein [Geomonas sp. RF6]UFS72861.1 TolC family protein [Geomonas sp. RF6]
MKHSRKLTLLLGASLLLSAGAASAQEGPVNLTIKDAIRLVVQQNPDVRIELYNPAIAEAELRRELAIFDPVLSLQGAYTRTTNPNSNTINFGIPRQDLVQLDAGASKLLSTGGTVGVTFNNSWTKTSGIPSAVVSDYYQSDLLLTLSQPLLKNFGRELTELNITVARFNKEGSLDRFRTRLSDTVAQLRNDYFTLYTLREDLEVRRTSLALSQRILEETRARVKAGVLPAMEILSAEFSVATREKDVIDGERLLRDQMDVLRYSLQIPGTSDIVTADLPEKAEYLVSEDEALKRALAARPELQAQRVAVQVNDLQQRVAKNRILPDLTLNASAGLSGLDPSYSREIGNLATAQQPTWSVGLQLNYPLGNRAAKNEYTRTKLLLEQAQTQLRSQESAVSNEVRAAIRALRASYKQLEVTERGRAYAEERLRSFIKKNAVGLATTKDVFDVENDLVTAKGNQIRALADYNNAITQLWRSTGEILERQGVRVTEQDADALYQKNR